MKIFLKRTALIAAALAVSPLAAAVHAGRLFGGKGPFDAAAQGLSLVPGIIGNYLRLGFYTLTLEKISPDVSISFGSFFSKSTAKIGSGVSIGAYCILGQVEVEDNVMIASRVSLLSGKYQHGSALAKIPESRKGRFDTIVIGRESWIGEGAVVTANVGRNCIVAAGAVVTRDMPDGYMAAGNPGKLIRMPRDAPPHPMPTVIDTQRDENSFDFSECSETRVGRRKYRKGCTCWFTNFSNILQPVTPTKRPSSPTSSA